MKFKRTTTSLPARASKNPAIMPAGPPPATQQPVVIFSEFLDSAGIAIGLYESLPERRQIEITRVFPHKKRLVRNEYLD
jgi:hypothetical protein